MFVLMACFCDMESNLNFIMPLYPWYGFVHLQNIFYCCIIIHYLFISDIAAVRQKYRQNNAQDHQRNRRHIVGHTDPWM